MRQAIIAAVAALSVSTGARASALVDQVTLVEGASVANVPLPVDSTGNSAATFTVSQSGSYTITVTDLSQPAPLVSLGVSVASSTASVAVFSGAGSKSVSLSAGTTYTVQPLANASGLQGGGSLGVTVTAQAGGVATFSRLGSNSDVWAVSAASQPPNVGESALGDSFIVATQDTYTLTFTDLSFPAGLSEVVLTVLNHADGSTVASVPSLPIDVTSPPTINLSVQFSLQPGTYDVFVAAKASGPALAGLYGLQVAGTTAGVVYAKTEAVGTLQPAQSIAVPSNGTVSLQLNDVGYPAALASLKAVVAQGAGSLQSVTTPGSYSFPATQGSVQLYVLATAGAGGMGAFAEYATENGTTLIDTAQPVLDSVHYGYAFTPFVPSKPVAAGSVQLQVNDYGEPASFSSLSALAVQAGALVPSSSVVGSGNASTFSVQAGGLTLVVFPELQSGLNGLFGAVLVSKSSGQTIYNTTQGVGALFTSQNVAIATPGNYTIEATDLGFPAALSNLYVIVTNGQLAVGQLIFSGQTTFTANAAGTYVINVLSQVGSGVNYGQYGIQMAQAVPPTVSLSASPNPVTAGGTTQLTWSSTNAASCKASGGSWSGNLATSGSEQSPAVSTTTVFVVTCTGDGGSANAQVQVTVAAAKSGGGGGLDKTTLLGLCLLLLWKLRQHSSRRRVLDGALVRSGPQARSR